MTLLETIKESFAARVGTVSFLLTLLTFSTTSSDLAAAIIPPSPTYAWSLDEGAGTTAAPTFGDQTGSLLNGATWSTNTPLAYVGNYSVEFLDDQDQLRLPGHVSGKSGSLQFWVYTSEIVGSDYYLHTTGSSRIYLWVYSTPLIVGMGINGSAGVGSFAKPPDDTWNHVVVTWDESLANDNVKVYVTNDAGQNVYSMTKTIGEGATGNILLGYPGWGSCGFKGLIDELAFWDVPLTAENVEWLSKRSVSTIPEPATAMLVVWGVLCLLSGRRRRETVRP